MSVLALPTLSEGIEGWGHWISVVVDWFQQHQLLMTWIGGFGAGALFIMGIAALSVWWEAAGSPNPIYLIRGLWKYIRITAIGKVSVRYASYIEGRKKHANWLSRRVRKGKLEHIPFSVGPIGPGRFGLEIPAIYRLEFSTSQRKEAKWEEVVKNSRRYYEGTPRPEFWYEERHGSRYIGIEIATQLSGEAGWPTVRRVFSSRRWPLCRIARMGWFVSTPPDHPDAKKREKDLYVRLPADERLEPKPDMPDMSQSDDADS